MSEAEGEGGHSGRDTAWAKAWQADNFLEFGITGAEGGSGCREEGLVGSEGCAPRV